MHNPSISILGPGPDVMLIEGFDCTYYIEHDDINQPYRIIPKVSTSSLCLLNI